VCQSLVKVRSFLEVDKVDLRRAHKCELGVGNFYSVDWGCCFESGV